MTLSQVYHNLLQASAQGFVWSAQQVPTARWLLQPPHILGEWSAARHVFHMAFYEQFIALPSMRQWLGASLPSLESVDEDAAWAEGEKDINSLLADFLNVRAEQLALLPNFAETGWDMARETIFGSVKLSLIVNKTFQHTAEHTNDVMRLVVSWDRILEQEQAKNGG
jgi:hypothetical protein